MSIDKARESKRGKKQKRYIFRLITLLVLLAAVVYALMTNLSKDKELYEVGEAAPDFELVQINDSNELEKIRLSDLKGKGVMLNFWGTWCEPCEREMPFMETLYPEYRDDVEIVAVSLDPTELVIQKFIDKYDLTFPVVHDKKDEVREMYKIGPLPSTLFIDADGIIVEKIAGALTLESLEGYFQEIQPN